MSTELTIAGNPPADKEYRKINKTRKKNRSKPRRMSEPFKCPECRKVWQYKAINGGVGYSKSSEVPPDYLVSFPSYGCTEYICVMCKSK